MNGPPEGGELSRLLIIRLGSMGDIIHTLPAVALLRARFPGATIGWAVERRWAALLSSESANLGPRSPEKPLVDFVHLVDTHAWRAALFSRETWREARTALREIRDLQYDVAIDFQGAWKSAILAQLSGAPRRLGFMQPREKPATMFYTQVVAQRSRHIVEQNLSLASWIVGEIHPHALCVFPLPQNPSAERAIDHRLRDAGLHSFVLINPGAGWGAKLWPVVRYAQVALALKLHGLSAIVNYGPGEQRLATEVEKAAPGAAVAMSTTVAELIALTRRARLCIGGDTGPVHLAAALGVPVVALFGPTDPARNSPYGERVISLRSPASRTTTSHEKEPEAGLLQITAEDVIAAARCLLAQPSEVRQP